MKFNIDNSTAENSDNKVKEKERKRSKISFLKHRKICLNVFFHIFEISIYVNYLYHITGIYNINKIRSERYIYV